MGKSGIEGTVDKREQAGHDSRQQINRWMRPRDESCKTAFEPRAPDVAATAQCGESRSRRAEIPNSACASMLAKTIDALNGWQKPEYK